MKRWGRIIRCLFRLAPARVCPQSGASLNIAADLVYRALRAYDQDRAYFDPKDGRTWEHDAIMWLLDNGYSVPASECER